MMGRETILRVEQFKLLLLYTQYKLYGTCYMGHILGLVEMLDKIGDKTSLCRGKYGTVR